MLAGGSKSADLLQALEDYLPTLLGLVKDGKTPHVCFSSFSLLFDEIQEI